MLSLIFFIIFLVNGAHAASEKNLAGAIFWGLSILGLLIGESIEYSAKVRKNKNA